MAESQLGADGLAVVGGNPARFIKKRELKEQSDGAIGKIWGIKGTGPSGGDRVAGWTMSGYDC